jgi:hypothetical protein
MGTKRYAHLPMLEGLRMLPVSDFEKHLVFYIERPSYIDVLPILAGSRDIPVACGGAGRHPDLKGANPANIHDFFSNLWK